MIMQLHTCPKESLAAALAFNARDLSAEHRDAWAWGIVIGWDPESLQELAERHGWTPETVARLQRLHRDFVALVPPAGDSGFQENRNRAPGLI